jgi:hypothetical protein
MQKQKTYRCPVCKKPLTKREFDRALHIHEAQQGRLREWEQRLRNQQREMPKKLKAAREEARNSEKGKTARMVKGYKEKMKRMQERMKQLEAGTTPQSEGLADEAKLTKRLTEEFGGAGRDDVQRKGHGGDVLHFIKDNGQIAGIIIYECKRTPTIKNSHCRQAFQAKQSRHADFAVLVTTGTKKGFGGLTEMEGVLVVAQQAVISLADLLRTHLIAMLRAGIEKKKRAKIANQLLRFIKSPDFKNPIEELVNIADDLEDGVKKEFQWHMRDWERRVVAYRRIKWDGSAIQDNLRRVLHGEKPKRLDQPKVPLQIPDSFSRVVATSSTDD